MNKFDRLNKKIGKTLKMNMKNMLKIWKNLKKYL